MSTHDLGDEGNNEANQVVQLGAPVSILRVGVAAWRIVDVSHIMEGISEKCK